MKILLITDDSTFDGASTIVLSALVFGKNNVNVKTTKMVFKSLFKMILEDHIKAIDYDAVIFTSINPDLESLDMINELYLGNEKLKGKLWFFNHQVTNKLVSMFPWLNSGVKSDKISTTKILWDFYKESFLKNAYINKNIEASINIFTNLVSDYTTGLNHLNKSGSIAEDLFYLYYGTMHESDLDFSLSYKINENKFYKRIYNWIYGSEDNFLLKKPKSPIVEELINEEARKIIDDAKLNFFYWKDSVGNKLGKNIRFTSLNKIFPSLNFNDEIIAVCLLDKKIAKGMEELFFDTFMEAFSVDYIMFSEKVPLGADIKSSSTLYSLKELHFKDDYRYNRFHSIYGELSRFEIDVELDKIILSY